jgi:hypothetical protein
MVGPVTVELELPAEARLLAGERVTEAGQLEGRIDQRASTTWWSYEPATRDLALLEWVVEAPAGSTLAVTARHPRAGTARADITA